MLEGVGLILVGAAMFALSRPYMEVASGADVPPPPPRRIPLHRKAVHLSRRGGALARLGIGQIIGLTGIIVGVTIVLRG